jgi:FlaA1/EpsC-like NDP-sugar epimerase
MLDLAKVISKDIEIVGKRPGEKRDEDLISEREISRTFIYDDDIHIKAETNKGVNRLFEPYNSASAEKMGWEEMLEMVNRC